MNTNNSLGENQFELFSAAAKKAVRPEPSRLRIKNLTVSVENAIVLSIVSLMATVLFFSLGVERGKDLVISGKYVPVSESIAAAEAVNDGIVVIQPKQLDDPVPTETVAVPQQLDPADHGTEQVLQMAVPVELAMQVPGEDLYTIQVASFKLGSKYADKEMSSLKSSGHETFILPKGNFSIVCIGKFKGKAEAQQFSKKLKSKYNDCLVRRL